MQGEEKGKWRRSQGFQTGEASGGLRQEQQDKDKMGATTSTTSSESWPPGIRESVSLSVLRDKEVCYLHPILQTRKWRLDQAFWRCWS